MVERCTGPRLVVVPGLSRDLFWLEEALNQVQGDVPSSGGRSKFREARSRGRPGLEPGSVLVGRGPESSSGRRAKFRETCEVEGDPSTERGVG